MSDVFGYARNRSPEAVTSTDSSYLTIGSVNIGGAAAGGAMYMIQNWNLNYQQQIQEVYELGSSNVYWNRQAPQGVGAFQSIVGPSGELLYSLMPRGTRDACDGGANFALTAGGSFCRPANAQRLSLNMQGVLITSLGFQMSVQDHMLRDQIQFRFGALSF